MNIEAERGRTTAEHKLSLLGRESLEVRGVSDVVSFDEQTVVLRTICGTMTVEGAALHIHVLSMEQGIVTLDGRVDAISYEETEESDAVSRNSFFGKLFR
ncbi:MAG: sporulation protein YabP [Clostridia bacterium]|nr:sporulation protein YabP [Clostridia bacterium]